MPVFDKAAIFTDIHFGLRNDSEQHNQDCLEFVEWFCNESANQKADTIIFMGDWFHNRVRTEVRTGHYSRKAIDLLSDTGLPVYWLLGNHDIYLKNSREINSLHHLNKFKNFQLIDKVTQLEDVVFVPWLVSTEQDIMLSMKCKYIFGHFELPFFLMNQVIEKVYDGEGLHIDDFVKCESVYSGHFHKRQVRINKHQVPIYYVGNAFSHDFNDANDHERGMGLLEYGQTLPNYTEWPGSPTFDRYNISDFLTMIDDGFEVNPRASLELVDDLDLPADEANELKEVIACRSVKIRRQKKTLAEEFQPVDHDRVHKTLEENVESQLQTMDYGGNYDPNLLVHLYRTS